MHDAHSWDVFQAYRLGPQARFLNIVAAEGAGYCGRLVECFSLIKFLDTGICRRRRSHYFVRYCLQSQRRLAVQKFRRVSKDEDRLEISSDARPEDIPVGIDRKQAIRPTAKHTRQDDTRIPW